ncbi:MAG TPA: bifunctional diaminohydroxyphosphoribosylaminopyrimidine deaminase/5-amino-6-(5-phosphoribosylamino)uracil reductase RibD [Negativicutes bacterium]|nr:bifunctional diaminohydroxyphosphoribosylaminopyrimidine deaminase/5-amino-6-(5-phosphoribosylamino)uracil reductase RibD [Negativicutes bacterium]
MYDEQDIAYMRRALALAARAAGRTSPNPLVGALVVKDGAVVGEGCHLCAGTPHAEVHALAAAGEAARGATVYATLEPCCHYGRTGPCADALIAAGVKKVVAAMTDPNPKVCGQGLARLRAAGVEVVEGVLAAEAARQNEAFIKWVSTGMPFGIMKTAMTLDGKIATRSGLSKWITGPAARERVHRLRDACDAILVGVGTVLADDPELTARLPEGGGKSPLRIVADSTARTPLTAKVASDGLAPTIVAATEAAPAGRVAALQAAGVEVLILPQSATGVDLRALWRVLGERKLTSVLVEGGAAVNAAALAANVIDKVYAFVAPKVFGGRMAPGPVGGEGADAVAAAVTFEDMSAEPVGGDILITAYAAAREGRDVYRACGRIGQG